MAQVRARAEFDAGVALVAASRNESRRNGNLNIEISVSIPAAAEGIVSVGAIGRSNEGFAVAPFSNTGPVISGPGVAMTSAEAGGGLADFNGTGMATPHVAGCTTWLWEEITALGIPLTAANVVARLGAIASTGRLTAGTDVDDRGVGLVQAPTPRTS